ncbi:hypothetical protein [Chitinophaga arvensicola]|uniref:Uncharacterized protein n=1 Tax=Chitinophaga arvensicola TaxID=29529 RepID=A0A1I0REN9_9BACT|nr:hypothetical protein [Chitinophaga arvensicola]SEW39330.1 hypothetical protein SAMN04488122_2733 [Chitinophaga arvensicola]
MKSLKFILMAIAAFAGISAAVAANARFDVFYVNETSNGTYQRVLPADYDLLHCYKSSQYPCSYTLNSVILGPSATEAELIAAGAVPSSSFAQYDRTHW